MPGPLRRRQVLGWSVVEPPGTPGQSLWRMALGISRLGLCRHKPPAELLRRWTKVGQDALALPGGIVPLLVAIRGLLGVAVHPLHQRIPCRITSPTPRAPPPLAGRKVVPACQDGQQRPRRQLVACAQPRWPQVPIRGMEGIRAVIVHPDRIAEVHGYRPMSLSMAMDHRHANTTHPTNTMVEREVSPCEQKPATVRQLCQPLNPYIPTKADDPASLSMVTAFNSALAEAQHMSPHHPTLSRIPAVHEQIPLGDLLTRTEQWQAMLEEEERQTQAERHRRANQARRNQFRSG